MKKFLAYLCFIQCGVVDVVWVMLLLEEDFEWWVYLLIGFVGAGLIVALAIIGGFLDAKSEVQSK